MPKIKLPTFIYWLFDVRPETIAAGFPSGKPFYCGKTVGTAKKRLQEHKSHARRRPEREHSKRLLECGEHVAIRIIETVPPDGSWVTRERHWIVHLRSYFPSATNATYGGEGGSGLGLANIITRLPTDLIERLRRIKRMTGVPNSVIIREGVEEEVARIEKDLKKSKD